MVRRHLMDFSLVVLLGLCPFSIGCGTSSDTTPASSPTMEEDVEVPTVELPESTEDELGEPVGE